MSLIIKQIETIFKNIPLIQVSNYHLGKNKSFYYIQTEYNHFYVCFEKNKFHSFTKDIVFNEYKDSKFELKKFTKIDIHSFANEIKISYSLLNTIKLELSKVFIEQTVSNNIYGRYVRDGFIGQEQNIQTRFNNLFNSHEEIKKSKLSIENFSSYKLMLELDNQVFINFQFDLTQENKMTRIENSRYLGLLHFDIGESENILQLKKIRINQNKKHGLIEKGKDYFGRDVEIQDADKVILLSFDLKDAF